MIQLRSLATLSHRRNLALVGRAPGPNTNSNEVLRGSRQMERVGGELELIFFYIYIFFGGFTEDDLFLNFHGGLSWGLPKFFFFIPLFPIHFSPTPTCRRILNQPVGFASEALKVDVPWLKADIRKLETCGNVPGCQGLISPCLCTSAEIRMNISS